MKGAAQMRSDVSTFKIRDLRNKGFFMVDDTYLNGYAKTLDPHATCVYLSLCRHADRSQKSFPSVELIAQQHNIGTRTVVRKLALLQERGLIKIEKRRRKDGRYYSNVYYLTDKSTWKPRVTVASGQHSSVKVKSTDKKSKKSLSQVSQWHTKGTHFIKETHLFRKPKKNSLKTEHQYYAIEYVAPLLDINLKKAEKEKKGITGSFIKIFKDSRTSDKAKNVVGMLTESEAYKSYTDSRKILTIFKLVHGK